MSSTFTNDTTAIDHNLYVKGDRVYQSNYRSGLRILDASGVGEGRRPRSATSTPGPRTTRLPSHGTWSNYPFFENGMVVVHGYDGLFLVRPTGAAR